MTDLPDEHRLWQHEMFAPIVAVRGYDSPDEAMRLANGVALGLTAGFYSEDPAEVEWFLDHIEAGVLYVNRETGRPPAPGPAISPSAAGKAAPAATKRPAAGTTCSNTCASSRTRLWGEVHREDKNVKENHL